MDINLLVKRSKKGDGNAFWELIEHKKDSLYRTAFWYVKNETDAMDIVSEAVFKAYVSLHQLKSNQFFYIWLFRILIHCAFDHIHSHKKEGAGSYSGFAGTVGHFDKPVEEMLDLRSAIDTLDNQHRTVAVLKYFEDMTLNQIGEVLGMPTGTVKTYLHRALLHLRVKIEGGVNAMPEEKRWQKMHDSIPIPEEMDFIINRSIEKASHVVRRKRIQRRITGGLICITLIFYMLMMSVHISPAFAEQLASNPIGRLLVQLVRINEDPVSGGDITDGGSVDEIAHGAENGKESVTIMLGNPGQDILNHYEVKYRDYPYAIELSLSGIRHWAPVGLPELTGSPGLMRGIYPLMTLDDASCRILLVLNRPADLLVSEDREQGTLTLTVTELKTSSSTTEKFSLRTISYPYEETVGIIESILLHEFGSTDTRVIVDRSGDYLIEEGLYEDELAAATRMSDLIAEGFEFPLFVEARSPDDVPDNRTQQ